VVSGNHQVYYVVEGNNRERHFEAGTQVLASDRPISILIRGDTIIFNGYDWANKNLQRSLTFQIQGSEFPALRRIRDVSSHRRF
jgi:hypothetical protein